MPIQQQYIIIGNISFLKWRVKNSNARLHLKDHHQQ